MYRIFIENRLNRSIIGPSISPFIVRQDISDFPIYYNMLSEPKIAGVMQGMWTSVYDFGIWITDFI